MTILPPKSYLQLAVFLNIYLLRLLFCIFYYDPI